ncbi:hypothetical protein MMC10_000674 [Thelotrema lepadinum]|nr:hypothetical protein [Thelotrema lepadinum]
MKSTILALLTAFAAQKAAAHATFQDLWVNGVDKMSSHSRPDHGATCVRLPLSNNPVTAVTTNDIRCNVNGGAVSGKCAVKAGDTVTVEMHQQPGDRSCANEAIGGDHFGPVHVYMSKVADASTADGSAGWFKVFSDSWANAGAGSTGSTDPWGTKDLNNCCGRMDIKIPTDIPAGDYLLRAEVIALHVASSSGGAQFYVSCYQITVSGGGSASPATVNFPGAYAASDPGILINIYQSLSTYVDPGPTVYAGGLVRSAGSTCTGYAASETPGAGAPAGGSSPTTAKASTTLKTTAAASPTGSSGGAGCAAVAQYGQCGGTGFTGCTTCVAGTTCKAVSPPYYSQCQ